jgi:hypothetical protein
MTRDPDDAGVFAYLDPGLHRPPLGIPVGVLARRTLGNDAPRAILLTDAIGPEDPYLEKGWVRWPAGGARDHDRRTR